MLRRAIIRRYTLEESAEQEVPLTRELDLLSEYVELMQIRFQGKLNVAMHVDDSARGALVPSLILQPLVENAIKHGTSQLTGSGGAVGEIEIRARRVDDALHLSVIDNGPGIAGTPATTSDGTGVGLSNTAERLRQMYGSAAAVTLDARAEGGSIAEIVMPFRQSARRAPI